MARWSGKHAALTINGYRIGDLENWSLEMRARLEDVTGVDDDYTQRIGLDQDFRVTADKFVQTGQVSVIEASADMGSQPFVVECYQPTSAGGAMIFQAPMFFESATYSSPDGAVKENCTLALAGAPTQVPNV